MEHFFEQFRRQMNMKDVDIRTYSPLTLAYVGDSVYDCLVKFYLVSKGNRSVNEFHALTKDFVRASEQALILSRIEPMLTPEEKRIVKWGRNAKSQSVPKNASKKDYQMATGFECLLGYLLMTGEYDRMQECIVEGIKHD